MCIGQLRDWQVCDPIRFAEGRETEKVRERSEKVRERVREGEMREKNAVSAMSLSV